MSNVWSGITSQEKIILEGSAVAIGNGRNTLFWDHPWLDGDSLADRVTQPIPLHKLKDTVADMWCENNG